MQLTFLSVPSPSVQPIFKHIKCQIIAPCWKCAQTSFGQSHNLLWNVSVFVRANKLNMTELLGNFSFTRFQWNHQDARLPFSCEPESNTVENLHFNCTLLPFAALGIFKKHSCGTEWDCPCSAKTIKQIDKVVWMCALLKPFHNCGIFV